MSRQSNQAVQIGPRIDRQVWADFERFVEEKHGKTSGVTAEEAENALKRHMGESELQQVDERLRRIESELDIPTPQSDSGSGERETVSNGSVSNGSDGSDFRAPQQQQELNPRTQTRVNRILDELPGSFTSDQLDAAIENVAGTSYKTKKKYRELLLDRTLVVPASWNDEDLFYQDRSKFAVAAVAELSPQQVHTLHDNIAPYWGDDWLDTALPDGLSNPLDQLDDSPDSRGSGLGFQ